MADTAREVISDMGTHQQHTESLLEEKQPKIWENVNERTIMNISHRLKDPRYRSKLIRSWLIAGAFFGLGMTDGLTGATLLDLQIVTGTDLERASAFVTGFTGGYMTGCLVGGVIFSQADFNLLLFLSVFGMGGVSIVTPYCSSYPLMIFMRVFCGVFAGGINTIGTAGHMLIWGNDGKVLMQIIHFCFALGGVISPLYSEPFLAKRATLNETNNFTKGNNSTVFPTSDHGATNVHSAFILSGAFMIVGSLSFLMLFIKRSRKTKTKRDAQLSMGDGTVLRELPLPLHLFMLTMLCTFITFYSCVEVSFPSFLMPFLINQYDFVTKADSVYITAIFWASFATSRFFMIFMSHLLSAASLLFLCLTLMLLAFTGFYISAFYGAISALSVFTAVAGLGMSGVYAAGFSWTESDLMKVTARVSSSICIISSTGTIFNPLLLGYLMEGLDNMWFCHVLFCQTVVTFLVFIFIFLFNRYFVNKRYHSLSVLRKSVTVMESIKNVGS